MRTAAYQPYVLWWFPLGVNKRGGVGITGQMSRDTHPHPLVYAPRYTYPPLVYLRPPDIATLLDIAPRDVGHGILPRDVGPAIPPRDVGPGIPPNPMDLMPL